MPPKTAPRWPASGLAHLRTDPRGWLAPTPAYWHHWLRRPELALVAESCAGERALHRLLAGDALAAVAPARLQAVADADVRESWQHFIALRDAVEAAGTLQGWLLRLFRSGPVAVPPLFIDLVVMAIVQQLLADGTTETDPMAWRAGELFFRTQQVAFEQGRVLAADALTAAEQGRTQGLGEIGRLLAQAQVPASTLSLLLLSPDTHRRYEAEASREPFRSTLLLDLTQGLATDIGHGLVLQTNNAASGLKPLARLLERWVEHLLGVQVAIEPVHRIDDTGWRWHVGLDAEASRLLDDLYTGAPVDDERRSRLISLFTLRFASAAEMRADVQGKPVYLALMAQPGGALRLKPQNLLLNLPLARVS
jgi:Family of unknown function (DUF6352)